MRVNKKGPPSDGDVRDLPTEMSEVEGPPKVMGEV